MKPALNSPKTCRECGGDGYVRINEDRPVRRRWSEAEGYTLGNTKTCPCCKGEGYEPEPEPEEE